MKIIPQQKNLFDLLHLLRDQEGCKVGISDGQLKNDFGNVLYLTPHKARFHQLTHQLEHELAQQLDCQTLIPPKIIPYPAGFVHLGSLIKFGYADTLNSCKYSAEWFSLFMGKLARHTVPDSFFADIYGATDNRRAHLAKDFHAFIRDILLYLKEPQLQEFIRQSPETDEATHLFIQTYQTYLEEEKKFPQTNTFLHPYSAYRFLYEHIVLQGRPSGLKQVILVENVEDLEPLFKQVLEKLDGPVFSLQAPAAPVQDTYQPHTQLYHFMTPLDEAEFVGWKVKSLLQQGVHPAEICVGCAHAQSRQILESVFARMELAGNQRCQLADHPSYRLVKMLFGLIYRQPDMGFSLREIFCNRRSKFNVPHAFKELQDTFTAQGFKAYRAPADALVQTVKTFLAAHQTQPDYQKTCRTLYDFLHSLEQKTESITQLANRIMEDKTDRTILNDIMIALHEMEANLNPQDPSYVSQAKALFSMLDTRELNAPRRKIYLEQALVQDEEKDASYGQEETPYHLDIVSPEEMKTMSASYVFLCGLNASSDRVFSAPYPYTLAHTTGLPTPEDKKMHLAHDIAYVLNRSQHNFISYPYLTLECKEDGQSALIKALIRQGGITQYPADGTGKLLTAADVITQDRPDASWLVPTPTTETTSVQTCDFTNQLFGNLVWEDVLIRTLKQEQGRYLLSVTKLASFISCPRKFMCMMLAQYCRMNLKNEKNVKVLTQGSFWHRVLEKAAADPAFATAQETPIAQALEQALAQVLDLPAEKGFPLSVFSALSKEEFLREAKAHIIPLFAQKEAVRQQTYHCKPVELEKKLVYTFPDCPFTLHGIADRLDTCEDGSLILWDYKTGRVPTTKLQLFMPRNKVLENSEKALQLALYLFMYAHEHPQTGPLRAGNIYLDGRDKLASQPYSEAIQGLLKESIEKFTACLQAPLQKLFETDYTKGKDDKPFCAPPSSQMCGYCDFNYACTIINPK